MPEMKDTELEAVLDANIQDSVSYNSEFMEANENYLRRYNLEPYGDEEEGFSKVMATDVPDLVNSDLTALVRIFLGSGDVMQFVDIDDTPESMQEAKEKTAIINHLALRTESAYRVIQGFLEDIDVQKMGVLHYYPDTVKQTKVITRRDLTVEAAALLIDELEKADPRIEKVDIVGKEEVKGEEGVFNFKIRITTSKKELKIEGIPTENFLLSRNASCLQEAQLVGHESFPTRGELVASGIPENEVAQFPTSNGVRGNTSDGGDKANGILPDNATGMTQIRWRDEGGDITDKAAYNDWASQKVHKVLAFLMVDYDGDGIAERRRIEKIGGKIMENEPYDHEPYAVASALLRAHKAIGEGRASLVMQDQSVNTELERGMLDNIYDYMNPRHVIGDGVNHDDFYDDKRSGVVRMKKNATQSAAESIAQIPTNFIGDAVMTVQQNRDQSKATRTGQMLANQGLTADSLNQETATRFQGIERAGEAKLELVARNIAQVGFMSLFAGLEWTLERFFDEPIKERLPNGKAIRVNPSDWRHETRLRSKVGLGAASGERAVQQLMGLLQIQLDLKEKGSPLVDDVKIYNTVAQLLAALDTPDVSMSFNNPEIPQEMLLVQLEQLMGAFGQAQAQLEELSNNPLAEAETIKAQASLINAQSKERVETIKAQLQTRLKEMELQQRDRHYIGDKTQENKFHQDDQVFRYTELELQHNADIPGEGVNG